MLKLGTDTLFGGIPGAIVCSDSTETAIRNSDANDSFIRRDDP